MLHIPLKDYFRETRIFNSRLIIAAVGALVLVVVLLLRLLWLQVVAHRHYETLSQANRVRPIPIQPPRGLVLDRDGVVLVQNFPVYTLEIVPEQVDNMNRTIEEIGKLVRITDSDLKQFRRQLRERPRFEALTLRTHLTDEEAARVAVRRPYLNGVDLQARLQRHYPLGGVAVHAVGYVGRISDQDLDNLDKAAYRGMNYIGKLGLEAEYEDDLLGRVGFEKVETNAHGRALRTIDRIAPVAGKNLVLNIDIKLQELAEQALGKHRGAVVVMQPTTGAVLAFVSTPTYDPNPFVNGIDPESYKALLDSPDKPLINRALNGKYSPGSTIKAFLGLAAMEQDGFDPTAQIFCPGYYALPGSRHLFRDWKKGGHGAVTLHDAIVQSCDVYFYKLAVSMGIESIKNFLAQFGFGSPTGIDLPDESEGVLPSPEWKEARGQPWYPGDTVITGIGQGLILVTPLQLADGIAAIANRGTRMKPHLVGALVDARTGIRTEIKPEILGEIKLKNPEHWAELIQDLTDVANTRKGTAYGIGWNAPYKIAGKTGTAQVKGVAQGESYVASMVPERFRDHALFIAMAPADHPQLAISVIVENGGHGASVAAPIARKVMDYVILGKEGAKPAAPAVPKPENDE
jgi:penicillin-binding protein 2